MERRLSLTGLALSLGLAMPIACTDSQRNPLPTIRLGAAVQSSGANVDALTDRDTTTAVQVDRPVKFTLSLSHAVEIRRVKVFAAGVRVSAKGAEDITCDGAAAESWATMELRAPALADRFTVTVTPIAAGAHVSEIELWGAGAPQAPREAQALAEATASDKAVFENAIVLRASPDSATLQPGSGGSTCLNASLPQSNPRAAKRAYLVYESTARRAVALLRSIDGQPVAGGFWFPPASEARTLVDEIDPERLTGTSDGVSLCLPDDATDPVAVSGLRVVLLLDDGSDLFARETHVRWAKAVDGDTATDVAVGTGRMELALDRPVSLDTAGLQLGAVPARIASVGAFDGRAWVDQAGFDLQQQSTALPLAGQAPQALQLTFSGSARTDVPAASVSEIQLSGSGVGPRVGVPRIVVTSPALHFEQEMEVGERFGDRAYVAGWAESPAGPGTVEIAGASVGLNGAFGIALDRPADAAQSWAVAITARFPDGTVVTRTIHLDDDHEDEVLGNGQAGASASDDLRYGREDETSWGTADANGGKVKLGTDVSVDIPAGAVSSKTSIGITRKGPEVMPPLDAGMVNVTAPPHGAYRFLPKGQKFAKAVKLTIPYAPSLLPEGMAPEQIQTFYYDEDFEEWRALSRVQVLRGTSQIVSETTHFTFMINAVLVAPDHPGPTSFNPNSIKDLKAADPSSGVDLIEAPQGNNQGTAQLALPIRLPRARGAFQPELRLSYDSSAGNGWAGVGWDLSVSSVQIDTKFGVPTYTGDERYLLDGAQLVPTSETSGCQDGSTGARYRARVERDFKRIVRCGAGPTSYWFEVSDKNGVLHVYGYGEGARLRSYEAAAPNIAQWYLERVIDTNGNLTEYFYDLDDKSQPTTVPSGQPTVQHVEDFRQRYLVGIQYTGSASREGSSALSGGTSGRYHVQVESEQGGSGNLLERPDTITSARVGFKVVTRRRLYAIRVEYDDGSGPPQRTRAYQLTYECKRGSLGKSRMTRVDVYGAGSSPQLFYSHTFQYTDADPVPFDAPIPWTFPDGRDDKSLTRSEESGWSAHFYAGIGPAPVKNPTGSAGFRVGTNTHQSQTKNLLVDVNGDGLPDRIVDNGDGSYSVYYNTGIGGRTMSGTLPKWDPGAGRTQPLSDGQLPTLGAEHGSSWNAAFQSTFGVDVNAGYTHSSTTTTDFLTDADGDGLIDVVEPGGILLQQGRTKAAPAFSFAPSKAVSGLGSQPKASDNLQKSLQDTLRPSDALLEWIAPYEGIVDVSGLLSLPARTPVDPQWDGVRLRIYRVDGYDDPATIQLGSDVSLEVAAVSSSTPVALTGLAVSPGTRLYFILSTLADFPVDPTGPSPIEEASFAPNVTYTTVGDCTLGNCRVLTVDEQNQADPTGAGVYAFDAVHDFKLAGAPIGSVVVPTKGQLALTTTFRKSRSSDDVRACVQKFSVQAAVKDIPCAGTGDFVLLGGGTRSFGPQDSGDYDWSGSYQVEAGEKLVFRVESDLSIDPASVYWNILGAMTVVCDKPGGGGCRAPQPDELNVLSFVGEQYMPLHVAIDRAADPASPGSWNPSPFPLVPFVVPDDGTLTIDTAPPDLSISTWTSPVWLTARNADGYLFKQTIDAPAQTVSAPVTRGELIYFEAHSATPFAIAWAPAVTAGGRGGQYVPVNATLDYVLDGQGNPVGVRSMFGGGFHGWHYGAWHGKNDQAFDASLLKASGTALTGDADKDNDAVKNGSLGTTVKIAEPLVPRHAGTYFSPARTGLKPKTPAYISRDGATFVTATTLHASREGGFVQMPDGTVTNMAALLSMGNATRSGEGETFSIGAAFGPLSLGLSSGTSWQKSDLLDMNGDRLLDGVGDGGIQITDIHDLSSHASGPAQLRQNSDFSISLGLGLSAPWEKIDADGVVQALSGMYLSGGVGMGINLSATDTELVDVNGDGLPDSVRRDDNCFWVRLNLGGRFAEHEDCVPVGKWSHPTLDLLATKAPVPPGIASPDKVRRTTAISLQENAGGGYKEDWAASVNWETSIAATAVAMVDVNGDGLPDYVRKSSTDDRFYVRVNYGYAFGPEQEWTGVIPWPQDVTKPWLHPDVAGIKDLFDLVLSSPSVDSVEANGNYSERPTIGFVYSWSVLIGPLTPWLHFSLGGDATLRRVSGFELGFVDIDGDGLVDHVLKAESSDDGTSNGDVYVRLNRQGKTNLLKHVGRPLGGSIDLDYARSGNTYDQPENRWVMTRAVVHDGRGGSGLDQVVTGHDLQTSYAYDLGKQDRSEREFLGFASVVRTNPDQSTVIQHWHNESFAVKGLLDREELWDGGNRLFTVTQNGYTTYNVYNVIDTWTAGCERVTPFFLSPANYCRSFFTPLEREEKRFYEGQSAPGVTPSQAGITTVQSYAYDTKLGNVQSFADLGDASNSNAYTADDLFATVSYATSSDATRLYFVGKPTAIEVKDAANNTLRKRRGDYDSKGNLTTLTSWVDASTTVDSLLSWTQDGNLNEFQGPSVNGRRHTIDYGYDPATRTYVTSIDDRSLGYTSTADYDPLFGEPKTTVDENGNTIQRAYDAFGRLQRLAGPYDSLASPAVSVSYGLDASIPYARTRNKHPEAGTVDTVVLVDGLRRVIQTKKTAEVEGQGVGWSVAGNQVFDVMGRVAQQGQTFFEPGSSPLYLDGSPQNPTFFLYDVLGRTVLTREPNGDAPGGLADTAVVYGFGTPAGGGVQRLRAAVTDPLGNLRVLFRDPRDHVVAVQESSGTSTPTTSYQYDPLGQLLLVLDAQNHQTALQYDWLGRRTSLLNPDAGLVSFVYDAASNLIQKQDANLYAKRTSISYDYVHDQLRAIHYPITQTTVSYEYGSSSDTAENQVGRVKHIVDDAGEETRGYGKLGETARSTRTVKPLKPNGSPQTFETRFAFDSFGRMTSMIYPDGEVLSYHYDAGGLVAGAIGDRPQTKHYPAQKETYLSALSYDEFGQRKTLAYGNGGTSKYAYDPLTRRLRHLDTLVKGRTLQKLTYSYDLVGNITGMANALGPATGRQSGAVTYAFSYDRLYRLTDGSGTALARPGIIDAFKSHFDYDDIHDMTANRQVHTIRSANGTSQSEAYPPPSNHDWVYQYDPAHPHQATKIGDTLLSYDPNGNTVRECRDHGDPTCSVNHDHLRVLSWNEENRLTAVVEGGGRHVTRFLYDAAGDRIVKQGRGGDSITIGQFFNLKGKVAATKHVFAGETRLASKLLPPPGWKEGLTPVSTVSPPVPLPGCEPSNYQPQKCPYLPGGQPGNGYAWDDTKVRPETYYYHPDHLGSTSWVTDQNGKVHEHVEYYPYGEVWWEPRYDADGAPVKGQQFLFSSKEFDEETGLYYFGARYYDPKKVRWHAVDPRLAKRAGFRNLDPIELSVFLYANGNPIRFYDPDGEAPYEWADKLESTQGYQTLSRAGAVSGAIGAALPIPPSYNPFTLFSEGVSTVAATVDVLRLGTGAAQASMAEGSDKVVPILQDVERFTTGFLTLGAVAAPLVPEVPKAGGRLGSAATREHVADVATEMEGRGWKITGGGGRMPEEYLPGPGGARKGASYPDITATKNGRTLRVNTADTRANGITPTTREARNAARIRAQRPGDHLLLVPKPKK